MLLPLAFPRVSWILFSCLILLCQVQGEELLKEQLSARISCPKGSVAYLSHCYALYLTPKSWMDANFACQKRPSGYLASVLSGSEASFIASLIKNSLNNNDYVWIGLHDPTEGQQPNGNGWEWINNDVLNYRAWEKNSPTIPHSGYCGSVTQSSGYKKWKDYNCESLLPYICKFKD